MADANYEQAALDIVSSYVQNLLGKYGLGTVGTGRMAARGLAQQGQKIAAAQFAQQQTQRNVDLAYEAFARTNPFEEGFAVETPGALGTLPPKTVALLGKNRAKLQQLQQKKQTSKVIAKERKITGQIAAREAKLAPYTQVRVSELRGPNAGYWMENGAPAPLWLTQRR